MAETKYQRLIRLLKSMFQLGDAAELDFGIYRIMHVRKAEIEEFLGQDLFQKHVREALADEAGGQRGKIEEELKKLEKTLKDAGVEPEDSPKYKELVAQRDAEPDHDALENEVYAALLTFFGRYYSEGDFISQRRWGDDTYAIPYNGEEVKLHWANHDQYYIKSGEALKHYAFLVGPENARKRVRFKLVAATTERDNNKEQTGKERWHILSDSEPITEENGELVIPFEYRHVSREELVERTAAVSARPAKPGATNLFGDDDSDEADPVARAEKAVGKRPNMRDTLAELSAAGILTSEALPAPWRAHLEAGYVGTDGEPTGRRVIEHHVRRYMAKSTFDYFIHKDLGGFLRRELDWYIKHEHLQLQDILDGDVTPEQLGRRHFAKLRVLRTIAHKLIDFLAQLEEFQKKLWLKKKLVLETQYLVRVGIIPEEFYEEIAANEAQHDEWVKLYAIDEINAGGYSRPLKPEFLKAHPTLVVDTNHFDQPFRNRLLKALGDLDEQTDSVLFNCDNLHALRLMRRRFGQQVRSIYIDPPYNSDASAIDYKNGYKSSSWVSLIQSRLIAARPLLTEDGVLAGAIDDEQQREFSYTLSDVFHGLLLGTICVRANPSGRPTQTGYSVAHEYILFAGNSASASIGRLPASDAQMARFTEADEKGVYEWRNLRREGSNSDRSARPALYYPIYITAEAIRVPELKWDKLNNRWVVLEEPKGEESAVWPKNEAGAEKTWRWEWATVMARREDLAVRSDRSGQNYVYVKRRPHEQGVVTVSAWFDAKYSATEHGTAILKALFGRTPFSYPKSLHAVADALTVAGASDPSSWTVDYFAGSGTTAHAIMNMNRKDGGRRRIVLADVGRHFDRVILPRLKKVAYSPDWKDGKPKRMATKKEAERSPRIMKVLRLESYEDALDNIFMERTAKQQEAFEKLPDSEKEHYRLQYMLDIESRGSASLLDTKKFERPFKYTLRVTRDDITRDQNVDLVETFNWLLGLKVETMRLSKDKSFKPGEHGIVEVTGEDPDGNRCLVIWRNTDEVDDDKLIAWFKKHRHSVRDFEWDFIYVNGDNTLENLKRDDETWTVRLTEEEFHRLMFEGTE